MIIHPTPDESPLTRIAWALATMAVGSLAILALGAELVTVACGVGR